MSTDTVTKQFFCFCHNSGKATRLENNKSSKMRSKRTGIKCIFQKYYHTYSRRLKTTWSNDPNTDGVKNYIKIRCFRKCRAVVGRVLADRWAAGCWRHTCGRRRSSMYCHVERPRCSDEYNEHSLTTTATTSTTIIILWPLCRTTCTSWYLQLRTHTHTFIGPLSRTTQVSRYHKGKTNVDFAEARDSEWQWHHLGCMQACSSLNR